MVEIENLSVGYASLASVGAVQAVRDARATIPTGSVAALVGPSGCGKTSIVHAIAGLLQPSSGRIVLDGTPVSGIRSGTAVIFQDFGLMPWLSVEDNAALPLALNGMKKKSRREHVAPVLAELGLDGFSHAFPHTLSGGMKQRVAVARALVARPDLLLMDEPFSSLDSLTREAAQDFLLAVRSRRPMTILLVTHSVEEAVYLADTVLVMRGKNPGSIVARLDIPENSPDTRFRAEPDFRSQPAFHTYCATLRAMLHGSNP